MKRYSISKVAKMFGISSELLRSYERKELVLPLRDANGYRTYTKQDIYMLSTIRILKNMGYSLDEVEQLMQSNYDGALAMKKTRCMEMEQEIEYLKLKLHAIHQDCAEFEDAQSNIGHITWATSPAMLRINNQINDRFTCDDPEMLRWVEHLPIVRISPCFSLASITAGTDEVRFGYAVEAKLAPLLGLERTAKIQIKESANCLTTVIKSSGEQYLSTKMLNGILDYCHQHNHQLIGDIWGITIGACLEDGIPVRFHQFYIPVDKCQH